MYWYYPYYAYSYPWFPLYPTPYDLMTLMSTMMWWMVIPYYYSLYFEFFRTALEAWKKSFESITKTVTQT